MKKAVAFLRVSSHRQKDNTSHDTQETEMNQYCLENNIEIVRVVKMVESAQTSGKRKQYHQGLEWALKNKVQNILFYVFDRETRNLTDNEINEALIRTGKIVIHYVREKKVYTNQSSDSDFFLRDIQAVTNKQFIRQLRTKVSDAMKTKAEGGWFPGNWPPLGYKHVRAKDEKGNEVRRGTTIGVDEKTSKQVVREFELRAQGLSCDQIRNEIIREGFIRSCDVNKYHRSAIEKRIRNPFYYGKFEWAGETYFGKHVLIVPEGIRTKVLESLGGKGSYQKKSNRDQAGHFGGGLVKCNTCECHVVYDPKKKKSSKGTRTFHYYHCTNGKKKHESLKGMSITEDSLWDQFGDALQRIAMTDDVAKEITTFLKKHHDQHVAASEKNAEDFRRALDLLEKEECELYRDHKRDLIDEEFFRKQIAHIRSERKRFVGLLEAHTKSVGEGYLITAERTLELCKNIKELWISRSKEERIETLKIVLSNLRLDGARVRYDYRKPFSSLVQIGQNEDWRSHVYAFRTEILSLVA